MPAEITKSRSDGNASTTEERNRRGSERVVLRVPVELTAMMPHGARINIQARTPVANAHGGLLDEGIELVRGQRIRLNNFKDRNRCERPHLAGGGIGTRALFGCV